MKSTRSIQQYFLIGMGRRAILRIIALLFASLVVSFVLARRESANDLKDSAISSAQAFHDSIIEGDIRTVEPKLKELLQIESGESVQILKPDRTRIYQSFSLVERIKNCPVVSSPCFDGFFGTVQIFVPVSMSNQKISALLYVSRKIDFNWDFLFALLLVFTIGFCILFYDFLKFSKKTSMKLSEEIETWADRLKNDPKSISPLEAPPFKELRPLKSAIEGLNGKIQNYETIAGNRVRFSLLRGIAHDLLSPAARLQLYFDILGRAKSQEERERALAAMADSLNSVIAIASQVKTLNEVEAPLEETDLLQTIQLEIQNLQHSKAVLEKEIVLKLDSKIQHIRSPFSKTEVSRVISNLVENAAHASNQGGTVTVELGQDKNGDYLSVSDQGCGIPESEKSKIFNSEFTSKPGTGTGLGLNIVKFICDRRAAKISFNSKQNSGTSFTVYLPKVDGTNDV